MKELEKVKLLSGDFNEEIDLLFNGIKKRIGAAHIVSCLDKRECNNRGIETLSFSIKEWGNNYLEKEYSSDSLRYIRDNTPTKFYLSRYLVLNEEQRDSFDRRVSFLKMNDFIVFAFHDSVEKESIEVLTLATDSKKISFEDFIEKIINNRAWLYAKMLQMRDVHLRAQSEM